MKILLTLSMATMLAACASVPSPQPSARLANYREHAGLPVSEFHYYGRIYGWESLDPRSLALWTQPREAWLLEFDVPCTGLQYAMAIGLTANFAQVHAGIDQVLVDNAGAGRTTCVIDHIRPLDVAAIKRGARAAPAQEPSGT